MQRLNSGRSLSLIKFLYSSLPLGQSPSKKAMSEEFNPPPIISLSDRIIPKKRYLNEVNANRLGNDDLPIFNSQTESYNVSSNRIQNSDLQVLCNNTHDQYNF